MDHAAPAGIETDLSRLFAPRSVALAGATDHPSNFGGRVFRAMLKFGYPGKIYPVNPRLKEIYGLTCYPGIKDLPETPDHVGIIVNTERVFDVLADCAQPWITRPLQESTPTFRACSRRARSRWSAPPTILPTSAAGYSGRCSNSGIQEKSIQSIRVSKKFTG